ncbi:hypothetical protein NB713_003744 [Xanthomonas sacchari]|nr:hypothetical protein [Xanthomonas sacchari]
MRIGAAVAELDLHGGLVLGVEGDVAFGLRLAQLRQFVGTHREVDVQRVQLVDRGQQRAVALADQRALGDLLLAGAAGDRRSDGGVAEVDTRGFHRRTGLLHRRGGAAFGGLGVVQVGLGHVGLRRQAARAGGGGLGVGVGGFGRGQLALRRGQGRTQRRRVDLEQRLAFLDVGAFGVQALFQHAGHAGAHVGAAERGQAADQFALKRHGLRLRLQHAHFRRRHGLLLLLFLAGRQHHHDGAGQGERTQRGGHRVVLRSGFVEGRKGAAANARKKPSTANSAQARCAAASPRCALWKR